MLAACGGIAQAPVSTGNPISSPGSTSGGNLLYVSNWSQGKISFYTYPGDVLVGTIADSQTPLGLCSDASGNVWVTNFGASYNQLVEYSHGGTTPIATLNDPGQSPRGCSVDPTTGSLAVVNTSPSGVVVFPKGTTGAPQSYKLKLIYPFACAYDGAGDLFVDGYILHSSDRFALEVLPAGGPQFERIKLENPVGLPGNIQWDGSDLAVGNYEDPTTIYRLKVSHKFKDAKLEGTVTLSGPSQESAEGVQFWIGGGTLVMPFGARTHRYVNQLGLWNYPYGGQPVAEWGGFGTAELYGVTVSAPPSRKR